MASSVDNNRGSDKYNALKEEYEKREKALQKRHAQEKAKLQQKHVSTVNQLASDHSEKIKDIHSRYQEQYSKAQQRHNQEVSKIRDIQRQKAITEAAKHNDRIRQARNENEEALLRQSLIHDTQEKERAKNYNNEIKKRENEFIGATERMQKQAKESRNKNNQKMNEKYGEDIRDTRNYYIKRETDLRNDYEDIAGNKDIELKRLRNKVAKQNLEHNKDSKSMLAHERAINDNQLRTLRDGYDENFDHLRDKYSTNTRTLAREHEESLQKMQGTSEGRFNSQVKKLKRTIRELKAESAMDAQKRRQEFNREKSNYQEANQRALDILQFQKNNIHEDVNRKTRSEIHDMAKDNEKLLHGQRKLYEEKINIMKGHHRESIETQVDTLRSERDRERQLNESQTMRLKNNFMREKDKADEFYKQQRVELERSYDLQMREQRDKLIAERKTALGELRKKIQKLTTNFNKKILLKDERYSNDMADVKMAHEKELRDTIKKFEDRFRELERSHDFENRSQELKYEAREEQLKEKYEAKIDQMRHNIAEYQLRSGKS